MVFSQTFERACGISQACLWTWVWLISLYMGVGGVSQSFGGEWEGSVIICEGIGQTLCMNIQD